MMGFLLFSEEEDLGTLNLCSPKPGAFSEAGELAGWLLASHAAAAFSAARTHAQLERALVTRHTIGEAMGIIMGRHQQILRSEPAAVDPVTGPSAHPTIRSWATATSIASPLECSSEAVGTHRSTASVVAPGSRYESTRVGQVSPRP